VLPPGRAVYRPRSIKDGPATRAVAGTLVEAYMDDLGKPARRCLVLVFSPQVPNPREIRRVSIAFSEEEKIRGLIMDFGAGRLESMNGKPAALHTLVSDGDSGGNVVGVSALQ
jgi:hypothetical protein